VFNIQLIPRVVTKPDPVQKAQAIGSRADDRLARLEAEITKLRSALMTNPDETLSMPMLREKLRLQEELSKALRDDLKDVKEQGKWFLGSMIAMVVGLLAVIATLFVARNPKKDA